MKGDGEGSVVSVSDGGRRVPTRGGTETIVLSHDPKAWEEGFIAGESTVRIPVRCQYPAGTTQAWSWHSGHVEGDAKRHGYSYSRGALSTGPPSDCGGLLCSPPRSSGPPGS
jgi:hypothetical protein